MILLARVVELCKAPINESKLPLLMINHHIMRFYISVHYPL
jgi:hypothetical protein